MEKRLEELNVEVIGGQIISRVLSDENDSIEIKTVVAKTINDGYIDEDNLVINSYKKDVEEKRITKLNDIIIKLTAPFSAVKVDEDNVGLLVSSFCSIIRFNDEVINRDYFVAYLNSELCKKQVEDLMVGTGIQTLSIKSFKNILIPVPTIEKQEEIGKTYMNYLENKKLIKKLEILQKEKIQTMIALLASGKIIK